MIALYNYFRSSASFRVRLALHYKQVPFEYRAVHLVRHGGEQYDESYRELNEMREVPTLVHQLEDHTVTIGQSMAILMYLDRIHPERRLFPERPRELARTVQLCENINSGIHPLQNLKVGNYLTEKLGVDKSARAQWTRHWIAQGFEVLERELRKSGGPFLLGDELTAADYFLLPQIFSARRFHVPLEAFPSLLSYEQRMLPRPEVSLARPEAQLDFEPS